MRSFVPSGISIVLFTLLFAGCGQSPQVEQLTVSKAWARPTPEAATMAAVYMTVESPRDDELIALRTPIAESAMIHVSSTGMQSGGGHHGGTTQMVMEESILLVEPTKESVLAPGGMHVMLEKLRRPLKEGDVFQLDMTFKNAGVVPVTVLVALNGL